MPETQHVRNMLDQLATQLDDLYVVSGAKVGADLTFTINATCSECPVTQTITRPTEARDSYEFLIYNPSSFVDLRFDLFTVASGLAAADRGVYITTFGTTFAVCSGPATYDCIREDISRALFGGGDLRIIMSNMVGSTGYTGVGGTTDLDVVVRLVELI